MRHYNKETVKNQALNHLDAILPHLFPAGKRKGKLFLIGDTHGTAGESLKLELTGANKGLWHDMATGEGGDILDLWAARKGLDTRRDFEEVLESIGRFLGIKRDDKVTHVPSFTAERKNEEYHDHIEYTQPVTSNIENSWNYVDLYGGLLVRVERRIDKEGKKYFLPWDEMAQKYGMPEKRVLYNLNKLSAAQYIVIVEGEKCAQALINQGICATTALGGAATPIDKTDWSPLQEKDIIIWPDNDAPGKKFCYSLTEQLSKMHLDSLKILKIPADKKKGWDAADAIEEGINVHEFIDKTEKRVFYEYKKEEILKFSTILLSSPTVPEDIIAPSLLVEGGNMFLIGQTKVGKTEFMLGFLSHMALGIPFLGFTPKKALKILYVQFELNLHHIHAKFKGKTSDLSSKLNAENLNNLIITQPIRLKLDSAGKRDIRRLVKDNFEEGQVDVFAFDPLFNFWDEDVGKKTGVVVSDFLNELGDFCKSFNPKACFIMVHHTTKDTQGIEKDPFSAFHGSNRIRAFYDTGVVLTRFTDGLYAQRKLFFERRYADSNKPILLSKTIEKTPRGWIEISNTYHNGQEDIPAEKEKDGRERKKEMILGILRKEALEWRFYTSRSFALNFDETFELGKARNIFYLVKELLLEKKIKLFQNYQKYGLTDFGTGKGYLCTDGMLTHEKETEKYQIVEPTHFFDGTMCKPLV